MRIAYFNGSYVQEDEVRLSIEERAFKYGDMAFDVCRTFQLEPFKLERHVGRLFDSLRYLQVCPPFDEQECIEISLEVLSRNRDLFGPDDDVFLRQYVSRGPDALSHRARDAGPPTVLIRCEPLDFALFADLYGSGAKLVTPAARRVPAECVDAKAKIGNYVNMILAELQIPADCLPLMLDSQGHVAEPGMLGGNIFIVRNGEVRTPALGSILPGISRETAIDLCREREIAVSEVQLTQHDVYTADEAFLTSTSFCILPVRSVDGIEIGETLPGPVTTSLLEAWTDLVEVDFVDQARRHKRQASPV